MDRHTDEDYRRRAQGAVSASGNVSKSFRGRCKQLGIDDGNVDEALAEIGEHEALRAGNNGACGILAPIRRFR